MKCYYYEEEGLPDEVHETVAELVPEILFCPVVEGHIICGEITVYYSLN